MKSPTKYILGFLLLLVLAQGCDTPTFTKFSGQNKAWPTSNALATEVFYGIPVYQTWPNKPYRILGRLELGFRDQDWNRGDFEQAAEITKKLGGDAVFIIPRAALSDDKALNDLRLEAGNDGLRPIALVLKWK
jgi:hypothetical protein